MAVNKTDKVMKIAIIHYNTPELTEAAVLSVFKHGGKKYEVTILDNSDKRPFKKKIKGVTVIDNTKGQVIDFDAELAKYPDKCWDLAHLSNYGSAKHIMSVQKLWELLPEGFILMESDLLLRKDIAFLWDEKYAACGKAQWFKGRRMEKDRLLPYLCYMNVPLLVKNGAKYFDPKRCWALQPGGAKNQQNWYDTGACLLEDIIRTKPALVARLYPNLDQYYAHYNGGSWRQNDLESQKAWIEKHKELWAPIDNSDAKIYICAHADFEKQVSSSVYEVVDARKGGDKINGVKGTYYSELMHMMRVSRRKTLPKYIGFLQYRKYFSFFDDVPHIAAAVERHGAIVGKPTDLGMTMRQQYATWGNVEDLDITTQIVNEMYPDFANAWNASLHKNFIYPASCFVMRKEDWQDMVQIAWTLANEFLRRVGGDMDARIKAMPEKYHLDMFDATHESRVGGQICERVVNAYIQWKFPDVAKVPIVITQDKIQR